MKERSDLGKCKKSDAVETIDLLSLINIEAVGVIRDSTPYMRVDAESFHARNQQIVALADGLVAFRVDMSAGTTFTIEQAERKGITVRVFDYTSQ